MLSTLLGDLRYAARQLRRNPVFTLVAVLSLGLGIGLTTTFFSVVSALLLRPLPVAEPERVVGVYTSDFSGPLYGASSYPDFVDLRARARSFEGLTFVRLQPMSLTLGGRSEVVTAQVVSGEYFTVVGRPAGHGRLFGVEDDRTGAAPTVVLSQSLWEREFGKDPSVVGRTVLLGGQPFAVIGVGPEGFAGHLRGLRGDVWITAAGYRIARPDDDFFENRGARGMMLLGRLREGVEPASAQAELATLAAQLHAAYPDRWTDVRGEGRRLTLLPESRLRVVPQIRGAAMGASGLLLAVAVMVLLIACTNLANLLLARATARRREIAVRLSLGAGRGRLVRQLLTESTLLACVGGAVGVLAALWATDLLSTVALPTPIPLEFDFRIDGRVLGFAALLAVATGVLLGLVPALQASRPDVATVLRAGTDAPRTSGWRSAFVVAQVALSLVLLVAAGLFLRSLRNASAIDLGFGTRSALVLDLDFTLNAYSEERRTTFMTALRERLDGLPGVDAVSYASSLPLSGQGGRRSISVVGHTPAPGEEMEFHYAVVGPDYFEAMRMPLVRGRGITAEDRAGAPQAVVVNEAFAQKFWPGEDPIGKQVGLGGGEPPFATVVGLVRNSKYGTLGEEVRPIFYSAYLQDPWDRVSVIARTAGEPSALLGAARAEVRALDPTLPISDEATLQESLDLSLLPARLAGLMLGGFGLLGLLLASVGLYGVMAYSVSQRTREIGIRMALGAQTRDVLALVVRHGLRLTTLGLAAGLVLALGLSRFVSGFLYGLSPTDPITFAGVALLLALVAVVATLVPARRATQVDPVVALRDE